MNNTSVNTKAKRRKKLITSDDIAGWLFISGAFIVFVLFIVWPVLNALFTSFYEYKPLGSIFIGLDNYIDTFTDDLFYKSVKNTLVYTIFTVPLSLALAFVVSILILPFKKRTQSIFKSMYYLPAVASGVALSVVWLWIYDSLDTGLLNQLFIAMGLESQNWLGSSKTAMFSMILMALLAGHGSKIIIYIAALLGIDTSYYEAAELDGATFLQKVRFIVIPLVKPTTLFLFVTGIIGSFQVFMNVYMMTGGGPDNNTTMVGLLIFNNAFSYAEYGLACAQALVLAAVIGILTIVQFKVMGDNVEY